MAGNTNSLSSDAEFEMGDAKVQMSGLLMKRPFGSKKSGKWQRRFFIVKEGFMLYYSDSESRTFERNHHFNIHPKGVIPLAGCMVEEVVEGSQKFAIRLTHDHFKGELVVGADSDEECKRWFKAFQDAGKVTWRNAQLGETIIEELEVKSKNMASEKQDVIDKLNAEASRLEEEKEKKEELEALAKKLEEEKKAIEDAAKNLREEKDSADQDLKETMSVMKQIEEEKAKLHEQAIALESNLESIAKEKELTAVQLAEREALAKKLEEENKHLEEETSHLKGDLMSLEEQSKQLEQDKISAAEQLRLEEETAHKLKEEVRQISNTALNLKSNLELVEQAKQVTETKFETERKRRIKTEKRLRMAEDSLKRLDRALKDSGVHIDLQIETDVKNLRQFFEVCIAEEQYEAQKLNIMKDALKAKPTYAMESRQLSEDQVGGDREFSPTPSDLSAVEEEGTPATSPPPADNGEAVNGAASTPAAATEGEAVNGEAVNGAASTPAAATEGAVNGEAEKGIEGEETCPSVEKDATVNGETT